MLSKDIKGNKDRVRIIEEQLEKFKIWLLTSSFYLNAKKTMLIYGP